MKKNTFAVAGLLLLCTMQTGCRENEFGTVDLTMPDDVYENVDAQYNYAHPCAMYNQADFDRVKSALDNGTAPQAVQQEFENLKNSSHTVLPYTAQAQSEIVRGDATGTATGVENYAYAMRDAAAAYQMALLWKLTGDDDYAGNAVNVLNAWAATCQRVTSNDANHVLAAGAQGYTFANAAEILRDYEGWVQADFNTFKTWMVEVFASVNRNFLDNHGGSNVCAEHYWSNWDLVNMASYLSIGILTENDDMVNYVVNYFYNGVGNGCIERLVQGGHTDPLGTGEEIYQCQESGRDQGHASMSAAVTANLCQIAYTFYQCNTSVSQLDFFAANDNAVMKMGEYVALGNLRSGTDNANADGGWLVAAANMPFATYEYCVGCSCTDTSHSATHTAMSEDSRGTVRPGWEIYYNHYAHIKGMSSGYVYAKQFADKIRPEGGVGESENRYGTNSGAYDQLGWGTLMLYRE